MENGVVVKLVQYWNALSLQATCHLQQMLSPLTLEDDDVGMLEGWILGHSCKMHVVSPSPEVLPGDPAPRVHTAAGVRGREYDAHYMARMWSDCSVAASHALSSNVMASGPRPAAVHSPRLERRRS